MLGAAFVAAVAGAFLGAYYTRSAPYAITLFAAVYILIFFPSYFYDAERMDAIVWMTLGVAFAALVAAFGAKTMSSGALVDVTLTGSGGGPRAHAEEGNIPYTVYATVALFFVVFFGVAEVLSNPAPGDPVFFNGDITIGSLAAAFGIVISVLCLIIFLTLSFCITRRGDRYHDQQDTMSSFYLVAGILNVIVVTAVLLSSWTSSNSSRGWIAAAFAVALNLGTFIVGYFVERTKYTTSRWHGRIWRPGSGIIATWLPPVLFLVFHAAIIVVGGYGIDAHADDVSALFLGYYFWFFVASFLIISAILVVITFYVRNSYPKADDTESLAVYAPSEVVEATAGVTHRRVARKLAYDDASDFDI